MGRKKDNENMKRDRMTADLPFYRYYGVKRRQHPVRDKAIEMFSASMAYFVVAIIIFAAIFAIVNFYIYMGAFLPTMLTLIIVAVLIKVFYFNKLGKRVKFERKLKRLCKKNNYKLERKTGFWKSLGFISQGYHFSVQTPQTKYYVRYITIFDYNSSITFKSKNEIIIGKNLHAHRNKFKVIAGISAKYVTKEFQFDTAYDLPPKRSENIVLMNPVPRSVDYLDHDGVNTPSGSGERLFGYTIYNGSDFLKKLENN